MNKQRREKIRQLKTEIDLIQTDLKKVSSELSSILSEEQKDYKAAIEECVLKMQLIVWKKRVKSLMKRLSC